MKNGDISDLIVGIIAGTVTFIVITLMVNCCTSSRWNDEIYHTVGAAYHNLIYSRTAINSVGRHC